MLHLITSVAAIGIALLPGTRADNTTARLEFLTKEIQFLAPLQARLTGSPIHWTLINHIQSELQALNLTVQHDDLEFTYYDGPRSPPSVRIGDTNVPVTSYAPYSGFTGPGGVSGQLIDLTTKSLSETPKWDKAKGQIALVNIINIYYNLRNFFAVWPGSPAWDYETPEPETIGDTFVNTLTEAADAGVKAIIYAWQNASTGLLNGQHVPFAELYQGVPTVYVQGGFGALENFVQASANGSTARIILEAEMQPQKVARTVWTVIPGTELTNESMIINTHTDGVNVVEENGHIALLAYARYLSANPPRRTTILLFIGQHMHYEGFAQRPEKATSRWLNQHPEYWAGQGQTKALQYGGQLKGVAGSCVEHMGAIHWTESILNNSWSATEDVEPEVLYASTPELNQLLLQHWVGAHPNVTRITNSAGSPIPQLGEGYPFFLANIPNFSLCTTPNYLVKIWPKGFDEEQLIDMATLQRQVDSFIRVWRAMDMMSAAEFGLQSPNGTQKALHI